MSDQHATDLETWRVQFYELQDMPGWYGSLLGGPTLWRSTKDEIVKAFRDLAQRAADRSGIHIATVEEFEAEKRPKYRPAPSSKTPGGPA